MDYLNQQIQVKAVILGETRVGKTSLNERFHKKTWNPLVQTTISAGCQRTPMEIDDIHFTFCIWDTAGQERFRSISPIYYRGSHVAIVVIDLTSLHSVEVARSWVKELRSQGPIGVPIVLLGNKNDMKDAITVPDTITDELRKSIGSDYFKVSALTGENVEESFMHAAKLGLAFYREQQSLSLPAGEQQFQPNQAQTAQNSNPSQGKRCC